MTSRLCPLPSISGRMSVDCPYFHTIVMSVGMSILVEGVTVADHVVGGTNTIDCTKPVVSITRGRVQNANAKQAPQDKP